MSEGNTSRELCSLLSTGMGSRKGKYSPLYALKHLLSFKLVVGLVITVLSPNHEVILYIDKLIY